MNEEQIGKQLRRARSQKGLTLKELSEASGVSLSLIAQIEKGRTTTTRTLLQLAEVLDLTVRVLPSAKSLTPEQDALLTTFLADLPYMDDRDARALRTQIAVQRELRKPE